MQHVGIHAMASGYGRDGGARLLAGRYQFGFDLTGVGAVAAPGGISGRVWFFEHDVHVGLRAHDLARCETSIQDEFAARLPVAFTIAPLSESSPSAVLIIPDATAKLTKDVSVDFGRTSNIRRSSLYHVCSV